MSCCTCERIARLERELEQAIAERDMAQRAAAAWINPHDNVDHLLDTLQIIGIPARDLADIYRVVHEWRAKGGRPELLELYRELAELRART